MTAGTPVSCIRVNPGWSVAHNYYSDVPAGLREGFLQIPAGGEQGGAKSAWW